MEKREEATVEVVDHAQLAELSTEEAEHVAGGGLLSSPLAGRLEPKSVWVREVTEDAYAY